LGTNETNILVWVKRNLKKISKPTRGGTGHQLYEKKKIQGRTIKKKYEKKSSGGEERGGEIGGGKAQKKKKKSPTAEQRRGELRISPKE